MQCSTEEFLLIHSEVLSAINNNNTQVLKNKIGGSIG